MYVYTIIIILKEADVNKMVQFIDGILNFFDKKSTLKCF